MSNDKPLVLQFDNAGYQSTNEFYSSFSGAVFTLRAGDMAAVHIDNDSEHLPFVDLVTGLLAPSTGRVLFMDRDWRAMNAFEQAAARGRIGCVLEGRAWLSSLSVRQNIMLRERHHTQRTDLEISEEADRLCKAAGLAVIPDCRPERVRPRELRVLEWVKAFMGNPSLVVLAFPERDAFSGACPVCMELVEQARAAGSSVVWISDRAEVWHLPQMAGADHYEIKEERWLPLEREGV